MSRWAHAAAEPGVRRWGHSNRTPNDVDALKLDRASHQQFAFHTGVTAGAQDMFEQKHISLSACR